MIDVKERYEKKVIPYFIKEKGYKNIFAVPRIRHVTINVGLGSLLKQEGNVKEAIATIKEDVAMITGQKPVETLAKRSIAGFGTRKGQTIGLKVTLRGKQMADFLNRLINLALPRTRDFSGISAKSLDSKGNLTIGIKEQTAFPEIGTGKRAEEVKKLFGFEVSVSTTANSKEEGVELLKTIGFPLSVTT